MLLISPGVDPECDSQSSSLHALARNQAQWPFSEFAGNWGYVPWTKFWHIGDILHETRRIVATVGLQ